MFPSKSLPSRNPTDSSEEPRTAGAFQMSNTDCFYRRSSEVKGWDVFETTIRDQNDSDPAFYDKLMKLIKLLVLIMCFFVVFICCTVSKGSVLLMTAMIDNQHRNVCVQHVEYFNGSLDSFSTEKPKESENLFAQEKAAWLWALFFALIFPESVTFLRCVRICLCKAPKKPDMNTFTVVFFVEIFIAIVTAIFVLHILPTVNSVYALLMTSSLAFVPSLLNIFDMELNQSKVSVICNIFACIIQFMSLIGWPLYLKFLHAKYPVSLLLILPISMSLISLRWAENYLPSKMLLRSGQEFMQSFRESINESRTFIFLFVAPCKILVVFVVLVTIVWIKEGETTQFLQNFFKLYEKHAMIIEDFEDILTSNANSVTKSRIHIHLLLVQILSSFVCYIFAKFACKICVQSFGFALPITLTSPFIIAILLISCYVKHKYTCLVYNYLSLVPKYVAWSCPEMVASESWHVHCMLGWWLLLWLSQVWISRHIWFASKERASKTEKLLVNFMYMAPFVDLSLALNRRRDYNRIVKENDVANQERLSTGGLLNMDDIANSDNVVHDWDRITRIYACATMWHETRDEMKQALKSIMRMDEDQSARENAQKYLKIIDPDYYQFETHVLFDDAFVASDEDKNERLVNRYVHQLMEVINESASVVHKTHLKLRPPCKISTPYGGRLIWFLPGRNKLIVHLKDKSLIRHRKRWSQVMYQYYLLGHLLMDSTLHINRKAARGENTYILALDGDIDFRTSAVLLLVDLMKKNSNLGAACGRVHPIGTGLMVWYQKFEYAISHWLQKATEHVFGCVLCSPGCFSLFRARALMSPNVMKRYTTQSKEPKDYVQFDQGEDRWLCTLLLQSGYRVEYNAASDAYTHCPESFGEFYSQRRRWAPSTIANILDLLQDYKNLVRVNRDISYAYMVYHAFLMVGTILGPGAILLMLVGAVNSVFGIDNTNSLIINLIPVMIFIIVCFVCSNQVQLLVAQIFSALYVFLMLAVLIGTAIQAKDQPLSPSTMFFVLMISTFTVAAILHPREFSCFFSFPIYLLCIPSMYLLLTLYSLINLNVVTWGTRETASSPPKCSQETGNRRGKKVARSNYFGLLSLSESSSPTDTCEANISFSLGNIFKCLLCTYEKPKDDHLVKIEEALDDISHKITLLIDPNPRRRCTDHCHKTQSDTSPIPEPPNQVAKTEFSQELEAKGAKSSAERDVSKGPRWMEDEIFRDCPVMYLSDRETHFWQDLIRKYLFPLDPNQEHQAQITSELKGLRDKVMFGVLMLNGIFVLTIFLLQLNREKLSIQLPFRFDLAKIEKTCNQTKMSTSLHDNEDISINHLEPVGASFILFFALILVLQIIGMVKHRFSTFSHILAFVKLDFFRPPEENPSEKDFIERNAVEIAKDLQCLRGIDEDSSNTQDDPKSSLHRQNTIYNLERKKKKRKSATLTLDVAFQKRFMSISSRSRHEINQLPHSLRRRQAILALERRRASLVSKDPLHEPQTSGHYSLRSSALSLPMAKERESSGRYGLLWRSAAYTCYENGAYTQDSSDSEIDVSHFEK